MRANSSRQAYIAYLNQTAEAGRSVLGAFDYYGASDDYYSADNYNTIASRFGVTPALYNTYYTYDRSSRQVVYSGQNQNIIGHAKAGAMCMVHASNAWAWDLGATDAEKDEFMLHLDATNPDRNMTYYLAYRQWCEQLADALEELKDAGVTVIYRPFVEMTNSTTYFWVQYCNTPEEYAAFKRVWQQTYDYMVNTRGLTNLLWCFAPQFGGNPETIIENFYPGGEYVDIIGPTLYSTGTSIQRSIEWMEQQGWDLNYYSTLGKPVGFSELGVQYDSTNDTAGDFMFLLSYLKEKFAGNISFCSLWASTAGPFNEQNLNAAEFIRDGFFVGLSEMLNP